MTTNANSRATTLAGLPEPNQSRVESYLGVIAGQPKATLPTKPQSRVEEYLEYIALNGGTGGGGTGGLTIDSITGLRDALDGKAIEMKFDNNLENIQLVSENRSVLSEIPLMTDQQVQDIKNLFV